MNTTLNVKQIANTKQKQRGQEPQNQGLQRRHKMEASAMDLANWKKIAQSSGVQFGRDEASVTEKQTITFEAVAHWLAAKAIC